MGYKIRTPGVQIFLRYKMLKWGTVPPNGVQLAGLARTSNYEMLESDFYVFDEFCLYELDIYFLSVFLIVLYDQYQKNILIL